MYKALTSLQLRRNLPEIREGLKKGVTYVLLYRGRPIAEIAPPSEQVKEMFFSPHESEAVKRIRRNVKRRRKARQK